MYKNRHPVFKIKFKPGTAGYSQFGMPYAEIRFCLQVDDGSE
jgi:hypothetical protein